MSPTANLKKDRRTAQRGVQMQHRHFALIADVLRKAKPTVGSPDHPQDRGAELQHHYLIEKFADALADTNHNFDRDRFLTAAGMQ